MSTQLEKGKIKIDKTQNSKRRLCGEKEETSNHERNKRLSTTGQEK